MSVLRVVVVGTGYVGLTTGACLASLGHHVIGVDIDETKVAQLSQGRVSLREPGLGELVAEGIEAGLLSFTSDAVSAVTDADVVLLCLPTPMDADGSADLAAVRSAVSALREVLPPGCVVVTKSTVPVGTAREIRRLLDRHDVEIVSNPEFLREGTAVHDFLHPDRIVVGAEDPAAARRCAELYASLDAPALLIDTASAELAKYAANCFLAVKLSYVNAIAQLCEEFGADITAVTESMGHDPRIGRAYFRPGPGWGGSCLPKDTHSLLHTTDAAGLDFALLRAAVDTNTRQQERMVAKVRDAAGGSLADVRIGVLGLTFKAGTDDLRGSSALAIAQQMVAEGAELMAYEPALTGSPVQLPGITLVDDPYLAVKDARAVVLLTEWPEFRDLEWARLREAMHGRAIVDTRNHLDPAPLAAAGLSRTGIGGTRYRADCY